MNFYDATVRLAGDTAHEVDKTMLTAPEIMMLRRIHGMDAVVRIVPVPPEPTLRVRSSREERERLRLIYCQKEGAAALLVNDLFGPDHIPLPNTLDADEEVVAEQAARDRELKDTNTTNVTQDQLDAMVEKAVAEKLAELPAFPGDNVSAAVEGELDDPDAPDPDTGRLPDHIIAAHDAKRTAGLKKKWAKG